MGISITHRADGNVHGPRSVTSSTAVMVTADIVFTIAGGPIQIIELLSECIAVNDATASTMQWRSDPTVGTATTISAASGSLSSFAAGGTVLLARTALSTAPTLSLVGAGGVHLGVDEANHVIVKAGVIELVIAVGSTTGTWRHHLRYLPISASATVTAA